MHTGTFYGGRLPRFPKGGGLQWNHQVEFVQLLWKLGVRYALFREFSSNLKKKYKFDNLHRING